MNEINIEVKRDGHEFTKIMEVLYPYIIRQEGMCIVTVYIGSIIKCKFMSEKSQEEINQIINDYKVRA